MLGDAKILPSTNFYIYWIQYVRCPVRRTSILMMVAPDNSTDLRFKHLVGKEPGLQWSLRVDTMSPLLTIIWIVFLANTVKGAYSTTVVQSTVVTRITFILHKTSFRDQQFYYQWRKAARRAWHSNWIELGLFLFSNVEYREINVDGWRS